MFNFKNPQRQSVVTHTYPSVGKPTPFKETVAGDFFMHGGKLYMKLNLQESKEIPTGLEPSYGTVSFSAPYETVAVVNVKITIS